MLAVLVALAPGSLVSAVPVKTDHVEAELVAERTALVPGVPSTLALRLKIEDGWHTYWRNPGDSGLPTTLAWKLPPGFVASEIEWPPPRALPVGPLVNYGYEGEVLHLVTLTPPVNLELGGNVEIAARADWLVCKEICIPDGADLRLTLPVGTNAATDPRWRGAISLTRAALPQPLTGWRAEARANGALIELKLTPPAGAPDPGTLRFFALAEGTIEPGRRRNRATPRARNCSRLAWPTSSRPACKTSQASSRRATLWPRRTGRLRRRALMFHWRAEPSPVRSPTSTRRRSPLACWRHPVRLRCRWPPPRCWPSSAG
jgi:thiol:disulfide interchange protein DsbD